MEKYTLQNIKKGHDPIWKPKNIIIEFVLHLKKSKFNKSFVSFIGIDKPILLKFAYMSIYYNVEPQPNREQISASHARDRDFESAIPHKCLPAFFQCNIIPSTKFRNFWRD